MDYQTVIYIQFARQMIHLRNARLYDRKNGLLRYIGPILVSRRSKQAIIVDNNDGLVCE